MFLETEQVTTRRPNILKRYWQVEFPKNLEVQCAIKLRNLNLQLAIGRCGKYLDEMPSVLHIVDEPKACHKDIDDMLSHPH